MTRRALRSRWWLVLLVVPLLLFVVTFCDVAETAPTASSADFTSKVEVEVRKSGEYVTFRFRGRGAGPWLDFRWDDVSLRTPSGAEVECGGDTDNETYGVGASWQDFYVDCGRWDGPGVYRLLYRGTEVDRRELATGVTGT